MIRTNIVNLPDYPFNGRKVIRSLARMVKKWKGKGAPRLERDICERRRNASNQQTIPKHRPVHGCNIVC